MGAMMTDDAVEDENEEEHDEGTGTRCDADDGCTGEVCERICGLDEFWGSGGLGGLVLRGIRGRDWRTVRRGGRIGIVGGRGGGRGRGRGEGGGERGGERGGRLRGGCGSYWQGGGRCGRREEGWGIGWRRGGKLSWGWVWVIG